MSKIVRHYDYETFILSMQVMNRDQHDMWIRMCNACVHSVQCFSACIPSSNPSESLAAVLPRRLSIDVRWWNRGSLLPRVLMMLMLIWCPGAHMDNTLFIHVYPLSLICLIFLLKLAPVVGIKGRTHLPPTAICLKNRYSSSEGRPVSLQPWQGCCGVVPWWLQLLKGKHEVDTLFVWSSCSCEVVKLYSFGVITVPRVPMQVSKRTPLYMALRKAVQLSLATWIQVGPLVLGYDV